MGRKYPTDAELDFQERAAVFGPPLEEIQRLIAASRERNRLERENEKLREALKPFAALIEGYEAFHGRTFGDNASLGDLGAELDEVTVGALRAARAALGGDDHE